MSVLKTIFILGFLSVIVLDITIKRLFRPDIPTTAKITEIDTSKEIAEETQTSNEITAPTETSNEITAERESSNEITAETETSKDVTSEKDISTETDTVEETDSAEYVTAEAGTSEDTSEETDTSTETDTLDQFLSQYTPYIGKVAKANEEAIWPLDDENCIPKKIWMLIREGTSFPRYPQEIDEIYERILESTDLRRSRSDLYKRFEKWSGDINANRLHARPLSETGKVEIEGLARRMKQRFPSLFDPLSVAYASDEKKYYFRGTGKKAAYVRSRWVFAKAILEGEVAEDEKEEGEEGEEEQQMLLQERREILEELNYYHPLAGSQVFTFFKSCAAMAKSYGTTMRQLEDSDLPKYIVGFYNRMKNEIRRMRDRLKIRLSVDDGRAIYEAFASETAWNPEERSVWEAGLTVPFARTEDKVRDIVSYYEDGYHKKSNYEPACLVFQEIEDFFEHDAIEMNLPIGNEDLDHYLKAKVSFTENGMHLKLLAFLGLYDDSSDPVTEDRKWKLSKIGGFATNLALVLYTKFNVRFIAFLHQEVIVPIPGCELECRFETLKRIVRAKVKTCTFEEMCKPLLRF